MQARLRVRYGVNVKQTRTLQDLGPPEKVNNLGIWDLQEKAKNLRIWDLQEERKIGGFGTSRKGEKSGDLKPPGKAKHLGIWDLQKRPKIWGFETSRKGTKSVDLGLP